MKYGNVTKMCALSLTVLSVFATPVLAAESNDGAVKTKDVVVTATKTATEIKAIPQAVEVITSEDIERMGANDVVTALSLANNLNLSNAGMTGNAVSLRGMSTNHTLVLVDGKRYAGEDTTLTTNVYALNRLNVRDIDRVEIVRGTSSSLYGSDAMGGVINIITKVPEKAGGSIGVVTGRKTTGTNFNLNFGKTGRWTTSFDGRLDKQRAINRYENSMKADGTGTEGYNRSMYGMRRNFHLVSTYDFENANKNKLRFDLDYMKEDLRSDYADTTSKVFTQAGALSVIGDNPQWYTGPMATSANMLTNKNKREFYHNEQKGASVEYTGRTGRNEYQVRSYFNTLTKNSNSINDRSLPYETIENYIAMPVSPAYTVKIPAVTFLYKNMYPSTDYDYAKYDTWVTEAKDTMYIGENHNLTFGAEYRYIKYKGTRVGGIDSNGDKTMGSHNVHSMAAYIEDLWQVNNKLLLVPSVRLENSNQFGSKATPKIGMTYSITDNWRFKANYGKGYKTPSISELYLRMHHAMGVTTIDVYGNPDLKPEESTSFDLSIEADKGKNFGKLTYFNNKVTNLIDTKALDAAGEKNQYFNVGKARINGVEAELGHRFNDNWSVKITHNILDAKDASTDLRLNNRAKNVSTLQLIYDNHQPLSFSAVIWAQVTRDYRYNNKDYSYNTLNFAVNKKWTSQFSTFAGIDNVFDKKVTDLYIDGRMLRVGAQWEL